MAYHTNKHCLRSLQISYELPCANESCNETTSNWIKCSSFKCKRRIHLECCGLPTKKTTTTQFNTIKNNIILKWFCKECEADANTNNKLDLLLSKLDGVDNEFRQLRHEMHLQQSSVLNTTQYVDSLTNEVGNISLLGLKLDTIEQKLIDLHGCIAVVTQSVQTDLRSMENTIRAKFDEIEIIWAPLLSTLSLVH